jgi:phosphomannomutase
VSSLKFGTSGLRGLSADLTGRASALYATAFARHLLKNGHARPGDFILVGRDFRESSPAISATCIGALKRAGLTPIDCGTLPTPALALYGLQLKAASLMITGSHIPADRNGIKFYRPDGEIDKRDEVAISEEALAIGNSPLDETPAEAESRTAETEALFLERNKGLLPSGSLAGLSIGV